MNFIKRNIQISFIFMAFSIALACGNKQEQAKQTEVKETGNGNLVEFTQPQFETSEIETGEVELRNISGTIQANGMLDVPPQSKVTIAAPMGGFVKETQLLQGTHVEKGQVVAIMQNTEYIQMQQDYLDYSSQLEYLKGEYNRQLELAKENINAQKALQQSKAAYLSILAKTKGITAKLKMLNMDVSGIEKGELKQTISLRSPITGFVTKVNVNIGAYVNPTDAMFEIVNTEHLHAELTVFEKDVPKLKIGQKVLFTLANENKPRKAAIYLIGREINKDRSVQIHCHLNDEDSELIPGTYLRAFVETDNNKVTALPLEAIINFEGKDYIFIVKEIEPINTQADKDAGLEKTKDTSISVHTFELIEVEKGNEELGYAEIHLPKTFNLKSKVVIKGAYNILAKMKNSEEEE
ncbi:MAG: efflux RND transporter periplasmic adaptor subunit [Bacteroidia bacterium]|nr:efflux RND transporter periplasmic adaptor subunit [Bacteroidia bacterium]